MSQPLDVITNSDLLFGLGSGADTHSKLGNDSINCSHDPQQVTQIGVAPFIEGTHKTDSRLGCGDRSRPGNLVVRSQRVGVFRRWRSGIKRQAAFDINLRNVVASHRSRDASQEPVAQMSPAAYLPPLWNASDDGCSSPESRAAWIPNPGMSRRALNPNTPGVWYRSTVPRMDGKVAHRVWS